MKTADHILEAGRTEILLKSVKFVQLQVLSTRCRQNFTFRLWLNMNSNLRLSAAERLPDPGCGHLPESQQGRKQGELNRSESSVTTRSS